MTPAHLGGERALEGGAVSGHRRTWLRIKAVARRHYLVMLRSPHRLFDVTVWPLVDVLLFGSIGAFVGRSDDVGAAAFGYLLAGIVLWHVVYQAQIAVATGFMEETWSRNLLNLMVTPLREWEYVVGLALFGLVKLALGVGLVAVTALAAFSFDVTDVGFGLVPVAAILLVCGWVISLFVVGAVLRFGSGAEALAWGVLFVVLPLSGVFYPIAALPRLLQPIAMMLPTTHAFNAMRTLLDGGGTDWAEIGIGAMGTVVLALASIVYLSYMLALFRKRGYISRYS
jgi:ABC-2 type transport system permease protein